MHALPAERARAAGARLWIISGSPRDRDSDACASRWIAARWREVGLIRRYTHRGRQPLAGVPPVTTYVIATPPIRPARAHMGLAT